jgi:hypothetical protein
MDSHGGYIDGCDVAGTSALAITPVAIDTVPNVRVKTEKIGYKQTK